MPTVLKATSEFTSTAAASSAEPPNANPHGTLWDMLVPIASLIVFCVLALMYSGGYWGADPKYHTFASALGNSSAAPSLVWASFGAVGIAFLMYVPRGLVPFTDFMSGLVEGMKLMLPANIILVLAWTLSGVCRDLLQTPLFVQSIVTSGGAEWSIFLPAVIFVIAAVKTDEALTAALASPCSAVFLLASTLLTVDGLVHRIHDAGKLAVVHIDLVDGLSSREIAVDSLNALCRPDGIISTRPTLIRRARHRGLLTVQRAFILDSLSLTSLSGQLEQGKPDFVEILPGIMPRVIAEISARTQVPVIAGGLLRDKADVMAAMRAGAAAVSTSAPSLWDI